MKKHCFVFLLSLLVCFSVGARTGTPILKEGIQQPKDETQQKVIEAQVADPLHGGVTRERVQLTVYNNNLAFVRDYRSVSLKVGENKFVLPGVSRTLFPHTLFVHVLPKEKNVRILEQTFEAEPLSYQRLLERSLGQRVTFLPTESCTAGKEAHTGILLGFDDGLLIEEGDTIIHYPEGRVLFDAKAYALLTHPGIFVHLQAPEMLHALLEINYLTPGLTWSASYTAEVNEVEDTVDFMGLALVRNDTYVPYESARVRLVATSTNTTKRTEEETEKGKTEGEQKKHGAVTSQKVRLRAADLRGKSYPLAEILNLPAKQTKNVVFAQAMNVKGERQFWVMLNIPYEKDSDGAIQPVPVNSMISIPNGRNEGLGFPLPMGDLLVYHKVEGDVSRVSDQTQLNHTPENGKITLRLGDAEEVYATFQQTDYKKLGPRAIEVGYRVVLKNHRKKPATIRVLKELRQQEVTVLRETHNHTRENGLLWVIDVPSRDQVELRYRLRITLPEEGDEKR